MKKVLITGASGYLGARLFIDLRNDFDLVGTYYGSKLCDRLIKLDVTDKLAVSTLVEKIKPNTIIHSSAKASSDWCENHPKEAQLINVEGTRNIVNSAKKIKAQVVFISSIAAIEPSNIYGRTKKDAEKIVSLLDNYLIIEPGLLIGASPNSESDNLFNKIVSSIEGKQQPEFNSTKNYRPTYIGHISEVIRIALAKKINNETIPVTCAEAKTKYDLAKAILLNFGLKAIPIKGKEIKASSIGLNKLKELSLPVYPYKQIIERVVMEIKDSENYKFN